MVPVGMEIPDHAVDREDVAAAGNRSEVTYEVDGESGDSSGIGGSAMGARAVARDGGTVGDSSGTSQRHAHKASMKQTILPGMSVVIPPGVTQTLTQKGVITSATKVAKDKTGKKLVKPPAVAGHQWRQTGTGWVLWRRTVIMGEDGRRRSKFKYVKFYPFSAMEVISEYSKPELRRPEKSSRIEKARARTLGNRAGQDHGEEPGATAD